MKSHYCKLIALAGMVCFLTAVPVSAEQWKIMGPRALGMGGAHVAVVNDASAQYWNPAVFGFFGRQVTDETKKDEHSGRDVGIYIHAGVGYQTHENIVKEVDDVQVYDFDVLKTDIESGTGLNSVANVDDFVRLIAELDDLNKDGVGVTALVNMGIHARLKNWAVGYVGSADIAAIPIIDTVNINPDNMLDSNLGDLITEMAGLPGNADTANDVITASQKTTLIDRIDDLDNWSTANATSYVQSVDQGLNASSIPFVTQDVIDEIYTTAVVADQSSGGGSFENNESRILFKGALISEIPLTYGHSINNNLSVGGNIKMMKGRVYHTTVNVFETDTNDIFAKAKNDYLESSTIGLDLGVMYKMGIARFGLVGRNLNTPTFDMAGAGDYELDPQIRAGVALRLRNFITLAADLDLVENDTNISSNYKSRNVGVGAEFDLFHFLRLRGGAYKNLSESDIGLVYTAGLGVNFALFQFDLGASRSKEKTTFDGDEWPEELRGELAVSFQF